jgi:fructokinase
MLARPIAIENDANCFAMAEAILGAGKGRKLVFGVIMGTGCGGGIVFDGQVLSGLQSIGGEWGHMSIDPNGPLCYCGQQGCVETYISGGGIEKRYQEEFGVKKSFPDIIHDYRHGNVMATQCVTMFFDRYGRAMANLINLLDPDIVVLGGGVSNFDELYTTGTEAVRRYVFNDSLETPIVKHAIGDSAGVIGAALIGI